MFLSGQDLLHGISHGNWWRSIIMPLTSVDSHLAVRNRSQHEPGSPDRLAPHNLILHVALTRTAGKDWINMDRGILDEDVISVG